MTDQYLVITPDALAAILRDHSLTPEQDAAIRQEIADVALRTEVADGKVIPPALSVLAELAHQVSRIAGALDRPTPTITEESAVAAWQKHLRVYEDKAVPFLEELGIPVEKEPTRRL